MTELTRLTLLGTASGLPAADRFGQTLVLSLGSREDPWHVILDAGDGASSLLMRSGMDHRSIRAILISHMHGDHHGGFLQLIKTSMHLEKRSDLTVAAPAEGVEPLKAYLDASYLFPEWIGFPMAWRSLEDYVARPLEIDGGLHVCAHPNAHLAWARQKMGAAAAGRTFESYSASLTVNGKRIIYSGNLNGASGADEMGAFVEPCDLLIMELAHVDPVELGRFLAGRAIGHTVVTHFHPKWNGATDTSILELIRTGGGCGIQGEITLARDGLIINM